MNSRALKDDLQKRAIIYAKKHDIEYVTPIPTSAFLFEEVKGNFFNKSFNNIENIEDWKTRTEKTNTYGIEMRSSNSSDALLMNIFSHPEIKEWEEIANMFSISKIEDIKYGFNPEITKNNGEKEGRHNTEIDLFINNKIICEAKLTEPGFTSKEKTEVEKYDEFDLIFDLKLLDKKDKKYENYQLIRNIIALKTKNFHRFYLICDRRRSDLIEKFNRTLKCVKDISIKKKCGIIFWQDLAKVVGEDLKYFLQEKYGL